MPGVTVTITEVNTNITYTAVTNESGNYTFSNLKDGRYRVSAELSGFKRVIRDGVEVPVNATVRVDMKLEVGAIEESVTVVGESPLLQTDRADTSRIIESVHLLEVPLGFNRNFQGMMITVPGALRLQRPHSDFFNAQDSLSTNVNGQSRLANNVQIEGIDDNHRTGLLTTLIPSAEAIETVNISTSAYDAEFGRAGGAITNVTLKSGTNTLKGSVFAFGNNEKTNAPGYFTHTSPPGDYLQSGFTLGGPLRRNKLFFFGDYQHISDNAGRTTRAIIPPAAYRTGDFSASPTSIYDPLTGNADGTGRTPFPNNIIPANRISPIARAILANVPAPNIPAAPGQPNYQVDYARVKTTDSFDTKFNWQMSQTDQISARLSFLRPKLDDPAEFGAFGGSKQGSPSGNGFSGIGTDTTYSTGVNYTRTWSSTLVMEARGGMNYFHNEALSGGDGLKTAEEVGIRGANIDEWTSGMTQIDFGTNLSLSSPLVGFSGSLPWDRSERTVQFATVFTKVAGNHTIKFGEDFRHTRDFLLQTQDNGGPRGQFQFRAPQTSIPGDAAATAGFANAFASFLLDVPSLVQRDLKVTDPGVRFWAFFSFLQDKWAVTPKLTIDLGLRHEYYTPFIGLADQGGLSNYDPATNTLQVAGYGNVGESVGVKKYLKNFGPRAGASYRLNDKTVLRGGYGVSTLPFPDNAYVYNYPVKQNNVFNAPNNFAPAPRSMSTGFPDPVFVQIPSNGIIDASPPVLRNAGYFHVRPDTHEGSLHSFNVAFQRELPGRFTLDVAYVGNRGHDVQTRYNENAATVVGLPGNNGRPLFLPFGKSADVETWTGTKTEYNSLQAKLDRRFSGGLLVTSLVHARARVELRGWRLEHGHPDAGRLRAELGADESGSSAQPGRELPLSAAGRARSQMAARRPAQPGARRLATERHLFVPNRFADRDHDERRHAQRAGQHAAPGRQRKAGRAGRGRPWGALVRHVGVLVAGAEHVRQFPAQRRARWPEVREPRRHDRQAVLVRQGQRRVPRRHLQHHQHAALQQSQRDVPRRDLRPDHEHDGRQRAHDAIRVPDDVLEKETTKTRRSTKTTKKTIRFSSSCTFVFFVLSWSRRGFSEARGF